MFLLPTLGRPNSLRRFFQAYTFTGATHPGMILTDHHDFMSNSLAYDDIERSLPPGWKFSVGAKRTMGEKVEETLRTHPAAKQWAWVGLLQDDLVPETPEWDQLLVQAMRDGAHFVSANGCWEANAWRVTSVQMHSRSLLQCMGYMFPPGITHLFFDDFYEALAARVPGLWHYHPEVRVEHRHVTKVGTRIDPTHTATYNDDVWSDSRGAWDKIRAPNGELDAAVKRVQQLITPGALCK